MTNERFTPAHIVLIEDNPSDVYLMKLTLEESGLKFKLTNFQSGADALVMLCPVSGITTELPMPDRILLDLKTADRHRAMLIGATMFIQKPMQQDTYTGGVGSAVKHLPADTQARSA